MNHTTKYKPLDEGLSRLLGVRHCAEIVSEHNKKEKHKDERETML